MGGLDAYPFTEAVLAGRERWALVDEDCLEFLRKLPDDCIDAVVCDPPAGVGFMGEEWDTPGQNYQLYGGKAFNQPTPRIGAHKGNMKEHLHARQLFVAFLTATMTECLRVLKPGGHAFVWALPRTSHWTGWAIEDAGFEVRDCVYHIFGNGFPKNHDIAKAIDKRLGKKRKVVGLRPDAAKLNKTVQEAPGGWTTSHRDPTLTAPGSDAAAQWEGWGTALKPAAECWWLARKPFKGTVAANVLAHGTGGVNIDASRVATTENLSGGAYAKSGADRYDGYDNWRFKRKGEAGEYQQPTGRWPTHLLLSHSEDCGPDGGQWTCAPDCPIAELDRQSGPSKSRKGKPRGSQDPGEGWGMTKTGAEYNDDGGASRFFYVAKPSRKEREAGLAGLSEQPKDAVYGDGMNSATKVRTEGQAENGVNRGGAKNNHPTVKSIRLMRYLCRLITPPGGVVLDPFAGSGSTGCGALLEGFRFIGIEKKAEYIPIAMARLAYWETQAQVETPNEAAASEQLELRMTP